MDIYTNLFTVPTLLLHSNLLISIPSSIGNMNSLQGLCLNHNPLQHLPESLSNLQNLEVLAIDETRITNNEEVMYQNVFCEETDETIAYMETLKQPWIAFKILAAGAIDPKVGFRHAFESGADFICVGMYDFQVVDDANITMEILNSDFKNKRPRPWLT